MRRLRTINFFTSHSMPLSPRANPLKVGMLSARATAQCICRGMKHEFLSRQPVWSLVRRTVSINMAGSAIVSGKGGDAMECPTGLTLMHAVDEADLALSTRCDDKKIAYREFAQRLLQHHREHCRVCANYEWPNAQSVYSSQPMRWRAATTASNATSHSLASKRNVRDALTR